jgi:hypothetical protein
MLNKWALIPVLNWSIFRRDCKVLLQGRGNRDQRNVLDLGLHFRIETSKTFSLSSCFLFLTIDAKKLKVSIFNEDERRLYQRISVQLTNLLQLVCPLLLPKLAKGTFSDPNQAHLVWNALLWTLGKNLEG